MFEVGAGEVKLNSAASDLVSSLGVEVKEFAPNLLLFRAIPGLMPLLLANEAQAWLEAFAGGVAFFLAVVTTTASATTAATSKTSSISSASATISRCTCTTIGNSTHYVTVNNYIFML